MNAMNMPGFTADTSLYQTKNHYQLLLAGVSQVMETQL